MKFERICDRCDAYFMVEERNSYHCSRCIKEMKSEARPVLCEHGWSVPHDIGGYRKCIPGLKQTFEDALMAPETMEQRKNVAFFILTHELLSLLVEPELGILAKEKITKALHMAYRKLA